MPIKKNLFPIIISVLIHVIVIGLLVWKFKSDTIDSDHKYVDAPITAKLVTAPEKSKKDATSMKKRQEKIKKEQERKKRIEQQKKAKQEREKKELEKKAQAKKDLAKKEADKKKKADADKQQKLKKDQELKKKKEQAEAEKKRKADEKRKKAEAERKRKAAAEKKRLKDIADAQDALDDELFNAEQADVRQSKRATEIEKMKLNILFQLKRLWNKPSYDGRCEIQVAVGAGGIFLGTDQGDGDFEYCESGKAALQKVKFPSSDDPEVMKEFRQFPIEFDPSLTK